MVAHDSSRIFIIIQKSLKTLIDGNSRAVAQHLVFFWKCPGQHEKVLKLPWNAVWKHNFALAHLSRAT